MIVHSIFKSINGEVNAFHQGSVCTFIRLAGCNLNCSYCDTKYARDKGSGKAYIWEDIAYDISKAGSHPITITGGEPMLQWDELKLLIEEIPCWKGISIETNGSFYMPEQSRDNFSWCADWKLSNSGMSDAMKYENFRDLSVKDFIKFVVSNEEDYIEACHVMNTLIDKYGVLATYAFSPLFPTNVKPFDFAKKLAEWLIEDGFDAVFSLQLHKLIGIQ